MSMKTILIVRALAVNANVDQRVKPLAIDGEDIFVRMCGTDEPKTIKVTDILRVELDEKLDLCIRHSEFLNPVKP